MLRNTLAGLRRIGRPHRAQASFEGSGVCLDVPTRLRPQPLPEAALQLQEGLPVRRHAHSDGDICGIIGRDTLATLQELRAETADALGRRDRSGLVTRPELRRQAAAAAARARDLDGLATALRDLSLRDLGLRDAGIKPGAAISPAPLPVAGRVSARFGEPDPWDRPGHGWSIEAPAFAQVTAPWDATVRYAGPLIDYGQVVVLEPEPGYLVVIAGLAHVDRIAGETVLAGEKLGDLGGPLLTGDEILLEQAAGAGQIRQETFYLEIRRSGKPLDPADRFDATGSEAIR